MEKFQASALITPKTNSLSLLFETYSHYFLRVTNQHKILALFPTPYSVYNSLSLYNPSQCHFRTPPFGQSKRGINNIQNKISVN